MDIVKKANYVINCNGIKEQLAEASQACKIHDLDIVDPYLKTWVDNCTVEKEGKNPATELQDFWEFLRRQFAPSHADTKEKLKHVQDYFTKNLAPKDFTKTMGFTSPVYRQRTLGDRIATLKIAWVPRLLIESADQTREI